MKIRFDEIAADGIRRAVTDEAWFPDSELERSGKVFADLFLRRDNQRVFVDGKLSASVVLTCDRCLESYQEEIAEDFEVEFEYVESDGSQVLTGEHEVGVDEMDTIYLDEPAIDVYQLLQQQIFLALPEKSLCGENCRGLCGSCGANLNNEKCRCGAKESASPFSVLAGLGKKQD